MSEGNIRINKVLRELNISLDRAVDYLKDKGIVIEASPNTKISDDVYSILCGQFAGDKGNKEASKGVSEEIRKEKEALRIEREKEIEDKRKQEEERQQHELIKAKVTITGPKQIGKIELNPKPSEAPVHPTKPAQEIKPGIDKKVAAPSEEKVSTPPAAEATSLDETYTTQYQNLTGPTLTGQKIDLEQFNKPKKKKRSLKRKTTNQVLLMLVRLLNKLPGVILVKVKEKEFRANRNRVSRLLAVQGLLVRTNRGGQNREEVSKKEAALP